MIHSEVAYTFVQTLKLFRWYVLFFCRWCSSAKMEQEAEQPVRVQGGSSGGLESDRVSRVRKLLLRQMLVGIKDGRFFLGNFYCIDKQGNIILQDTVEYRSTRRSSPSPMEQRCIGLILIPSSCRTSCHVDCSIDEQLSLLSLPEKWVVLGFHLFHWWIVDGIQEFSIFC
jgi:small nuclear ribonucleoprotein (snRNP)-like protein